MRTRSQNFRTARTSEPSSSFLRIVSAVIGDGDLSSELEALKGLDMDDDCRAALGEYRDWVALDGQWRDQKQAAEASAKSTKFSNEFSDDCSKIWDLAEEIACIPANGTSTEIKVQASHRPISDPGTIELDCRGRDHQTRSSAISACSENWRWCHEGQAPKTATKRKAAQGPRNSTVTEFVRRVRTGKCIRAGESQSEGGESWMPR